MYTTFPPVFVQVARDSFFFTQIASSTRTPRRSRATLDAFQIVRCVASVFQHSSRMQQHQSGGADDGLELVDGARDTSEHLHALRRD
eukprot:2838146-Rhodomonas_salina.1